MTDIFPDPSLHYEQGLVAVGGPLTLEVLKEAYEKGIFPWPQVGYPMLWFCPDKRGILHFSEFKIPRSLKKKLKLYENCTVTRNQAFERVIRACAAQKRKDQKGSWITDEIVEAYIELFDNGHAHSWEVWKNGLLVGGGYGVLFKGVFSGESLFHKETDMSKLALIKMIEDLKSEGHSWIDTQMVTPLLALFGAREIDKLDYLKTLKERQKIFSLS